jgi:hypothetical protein
MKETNPDPGMVARLAAAGVPEALLDRARQLRRSMAPMRAEDRLPLINIALATLRAAPHSERERVRRFVGALVAVDRHTTIFEFVLLALLARQLDPGAGRADATVHLRFEPVLPEIRILLSALARAGDTSEPAAQAAFARVMAGFTPGAMELAPVAESNAERLSEVLAELDGLSPFLKRSLINACADCVLHDGKVMPAEAELLRAVAETLDCPIPPLLPDAQ